MSLKTLRLTSDPSYEKHDREQQTYRESRGLRWEWLENHTGAWFKEIFACSVVFESRLTRIVAKQIRQRLPCPRADRNRVASPVKDLDGNDLQDLSPTALADKE
jgi:hypothetical protein